jgi:hypothetical protein
MKFAILLLAILVTGPSYAQEIFPIPKKKKPGVIYHKYKFDPNRKDMLYSLPPVTFGSPAPETRFLQTLPNGNSLYALPQDNMPCVVPNESLTMAIPNVSGRLPIPYRYKGPDAIPNPAVPIEIKPKKIIQKK